jgi:hypothetical protein
MVLQQRNRCRHSSLYVLSVCLVASCSDYKAVGLEVNPEKTKYMLVSRCQKAGRAEHKDRE